MISKLRRFGQCLRPEEHAARVIQPVEITNWGYFTPKSVEWYGPLLIAAFWAHLVEIIRTTLPLQFTHPQERTWICLMLVIVYSHLYMGFIICRIDIIICLQDCLQLFFSSFGLQDWLCQGIYGIQFTFEILMMYVPQIIFIYIYIFQVVQLSWANPGHVELWKVVFSRLIVWGIVFFNLDMLLKKMMQSYGTLRTPPQSLITGLFRDNDGS